MNLVRGVAVLATAALCLATACGDGDGDGQGGSGGDLGGACSRACENLDRQCPSPATSCELSICTAARLPGCESEGLAFLECVAKLQGIECPGDVAATQGCAESFEALDTCFSGG